MERPFSRARRASTLHRYSSAVGCALCLDLDFAIKNQNLRAHEQFCTPRDRSGRLRALRVSIRVGSSATEDPRDLGCRLSPPSRSYSERPLTQDNSEETYD